MPGPFEINHCFDIAIHQVYRHLTSNRDEWRDQIKEKFDQMHPKHQKELTKRRKYAEVEEIIRGIIEGEIVPGDSRLVKVAGTLAKVIYTSLEKEDNPLTADFSLKVAMLHGELLAVDSKVKEGLVVKYLIKIFSDLVDDLISPLS